MKLFEGNAIKKINKLLNNAEKRKEKLQNKVATLQEEANQLYQAVQTDFNEAILEDKEPSKKLTSDLEKVREELKHAQFQLSQIDAVVNSELEKAKVDVDKERREFVKDKKAEFTKLFDEMNEMKIAYLNKIIEYREKHAEYTREYWATFREVEDRVGLRRNDPRDDFHLNVSQRYQTNEHYSPMLYPDEIREAFVEHRLASVTARNKDAFKN